MTTLETLVEGLPDIESRPDVAVLRWWEGTPAWSFVVEHADKILRKLRIVSTDEDRRDLATELRWGLMLAQGVGNRVAYEKYDSGAARSPDYTVERRDLAFNVEVKNLRATDLETRMRAWEQRMRDRLSGLNPTRYVLVGFTMRNSHDEDPADWLETIESAEEELAQVATALVLRSQLEVGEREEVPLGHGISLDLVAVEDEPRRVGSAGSITPVMYSQREHLKFGAILMEKLGQMRSGEINVLVIDTRNDTHERYDLDSAIYELMRCEDVVFQRKGFDGRRDFWERARVLSGVVFRTAWLPPLLDRPRNHVWVNPQATNPLPRDLQGDLAFLDEPQMHALRRTR